MVSGNLIFAENRKNHCITPIDWLYRVSYNGFS